MCGRRKEEEVVKVKDIEREREWKGEEGSHCGGDVGV